MSGWVGGWVTEWGVNERVKVGGAGLWGESVSA